MKPKEEIVEIDGEVINLKKDFMGWRVVYPLKNQDGTFNWFNFLTGGSYWRLLILIIIVTFILFAAWAYKHDTSFCRELISNGTIFCKQPDYMEKVNPLNFSLNSLR